MDWCTKRPYEKAENFSSRISTVRQLAIYMDNIGVDSYIIAKGYFKSGEKHVPYIYRTNELKNFFQETDKCHRNYQCPYRHLIMPIFFRLLYSCGLRASEARLLKVQDVDLTANILSIHQSKKDNSRLVPMTSEMGAKCQKYYHQVHQHSSGKRYFFPFVDDRPMTLGNVYKNFRKFLWRARISHGGRGFGPRVHDLRHTFAVHCLKKWVTEGKDLLAYLPILRTYLGHDSFEETAYYLRLTADVFPTITLKLEAAYPHLIPVLEGEDSEF
ncbi:tyrosine-type recombinase/integrase [Candidatus Uabimicrobium sp. HlEnr_7]|uniref:tyrosine-type recombinase/integrase n=1 Tax=Candidatus Uabimicrobium helgolandensis TaxID=3095367 RepID=UPI0035576248